MKCRTCGRALTREDERCPGCGAPNPGASGLFQTSTVVIAAGGKQRVYRSVEEVPAALRTQLLKSTNGANSATILIADRKGRREIARAMRRLPGPAQRRLRDAILGRDAAGNAPTWATARMKRALLLALVLSALAIVAAVFTR
jgi:hypothetical protein